jgi:hypothetical protein
MARADEEGSRQKGLRAAFTMASAAELSSTWGEASRRRRAKIVNAAPRAGKSNVKPLDKPLEMLLKKADDTCYVASARLFAPSSTSSCKIFCAFSGSSKMGL